MIKQKRLPLKKIEKIPKNVLRNNINGFLFAMPWIIGFFSLWLVPMISSLYYSFTEFNIFSPPEWIGLSNYSELFGDDVFYKSVNNTLYMTVIFVPLSIVLSLFMAILLNTKIRFQGIFRTLFYIPSVLPLVATSMLWMWMFNYEYGLLNFFLRSIGVSNPPTWLEDPIWTKPALIIMGVWGIGNSVILFLASLQEVPQIYYEAATIDGANAFGRFFYITLPSISNIILYQIIIGIIGMLQYFTQAYVLLQKHLGTAAGGPENSMLFYCLNLYYNAFIYFKMGKASSMAWLLFLVTVLVTLIIFKSSVRWVYYGGDEN
jgi:multiple sugar transport system permease protein